LAIALAGIATGLYFVVLHPPTDDSYYPKCTLHSTTGLHCPGCGLTRSVYSTLHGELAQAIAYNLFAPVLIPLMAYGLLRSLWSTAFPTPLAEPGKARPRRRVSWLGRWYPALLAAALILFGVLRNIPVYPLTLLAPHELSP